ncbi:MerR family transcriptional regulator [Calothrix sp. HK-06]|nr:MerR family transcriptional regulator [Calothrix sp. HK-06]
MQDTFFTSKQAAQITGCTLRQLQYWREKGIIIPVISDAGTGRSIYYSKRNLFELAVMVHLLSCGLNFDVASQTLASLRDKESDALKSNYNKRFMLVQLDIGNSVKNKISQKFSLVEFDKEKAIILLEQGKLVIPVWLDVICGKVNV